jgi:hypothetical protein
MLLDASVVVPTRLCAVGQGPPAQRILGGPDGLGLRYVHRHAWLALRRGWLVRGAGEPFQTCLVAVPKLATAGSALSSLPNRPAATLARKPCAPDEIVDRLVARVTAIVGTRLTNCVGCCKSPMAPSVKSPSHPQENDLAEVSALLVASCITAGLGPTARRRGRPRGGRCRCAPRGPTALPDSRAGFQVEHPPASEVEVLLVDGDLDLECVTRP